MIELVAGCLAGLENVVVDDLKAVLGEAIEHIQVISHDALRCGEAACGKVLVQLKDSTVDLQAVRSVQFWLVGLYQASLQGKTMPEVMQHVSSNLSKDKLSSLFQSWQDLIPSSAEYEALKEKIATSFSFWARCVRSGEHSYSSVDLASAVGGHIKDSMNWSVDLKDPALSVTIIVSYDKICLGYLLPMGAKASTKSHLPSESRPPVLHLSHTTNLRPSTAYLMLKLAKPKPFEIAVDAMAGPGAGFLEAAYAHHCVSIGGDVNTGLQSHYAQSISIAGQMSKSKVIAENVFWTFRRSCLRSSSIDIGFIDIPFRKVGPPIASYLKARYRQIVAEFARILVRGTGRCVLLTETHEQLLNCFNSVYFHHIRCFPINMDGLLSYIILACRTEEEFIPAHFAHDMEEREDSRRIVGGKRKERN